MAAADSEEVLAICQATKILREGAAFTTTRSSSWLGEFDVHAKLL